MCRRDQYGTQHCYPVTSRAYESAMALIKASTDPQRVTLVDQYGTTLIDHATTGVGAVEITEARDLFAETFRIFPARDRVQEQAREDILAALDLISLQGTMKAEGLDTKRRRAHYDKFGTHALPPVPACP